MSGNVIEKMAKEIQRRNLPVDVRGYVKPKGESKADYSAFQDDPCGYAKEVLGVSWTGDQQTIANNLMKYKRVSVRASHAVGKTMMAGGLVNWFFDAYDPGIVITTAPTQAQVVDLLWKEVRVQRHGRPGLLPSSPRMQSAPDHFAAGYTAKDAASFQGRHEENVLIIFDEATGVQKAFWESAEGMLTSGNCYMLAIYNPLDPECEARRAEESGLVSVYTMSVLNHPNILAHLEGRPEPLPAAVSYRWLEERLHMWCQKILKGDATPNDFEWPPGSGVWYRPDSRFESRVLGRWPTKSIRNIFTEQLWNAMLMWMPEDTSHETKIGCDVARYGSNNTSMFARRGRTALSHETHNGWSTSKTAARLCEIAEENCNKGEQPKDIQIIVDDTGVGGGVVDEGEGTGYTFVGINAQQRALDPEKYPNARTEMWFNGKARAEQFNTDLSRLSEESKELLKTQLLMPKYKMDGQGRNIMESKDQIIDRLGRSTDDADSMLLAYYPAPVAEEGDEDDYIGIMGRS